MRMNHSALRLAGCVCIAQALGLIIFILREKLWMRGTGSAAEAIPVTEFSQRTSAKSGDRAEQSKNQREEFDTARKRGMSEQDVRWIVADFINLGIDSEEVGAGSAEDYFKIRNDRHQWLLATLVSGFGLSGQQKMELAESLRVLGERDLEEFRKYVAETKSFEVEGKEYRIVDGSKVRKLTDAEYWLKGEDYAPWNLCALDEIQTSMIRSKNEAGQWIQMNDGSRSIDYGTDDHYSDLTEPNTEYGDFISSAGRFFPLSMEQVDRIRDNTVSAPALNITVSSRKSLQSLVKNLAPAQLKIMLLFNPEMAGELRAELEK